MQKRKLIFSPGYSSSMPGHAFVPGKFELAARMLLGEGDVDGFNEPQLPDPEDLMLAHTREWVARVVNCALTRADERKAEIPCNESVCLAHQLACSGAIMACLEALETGLGLHCGGGGHHAFADRGEGFCLLNDLAVGVAKMRALGRIKRAVIIDLDAHQGNGTASIFADTPEVFTYSIHQRDLYPEIKGKSSLDVELLKGAGDAEYMTALADTLPRVLDEHKPELALCLCAADCYEHDRLGGLKVTFGGMRRRDEFVFSECAKRSIPAATALGGGYAEDMNDTVRLHAQSLRTALAIAGKR